MTIFFVWGGTIIPSLFSYLSRVPQHSDTPITTYFFDGDPSICFTNNQENWPQRLSEIAHQYSRHRLVFIGNSDQFFRIDIRCPEPWVEQLLMWEKPTILTPKPVSEWGQSEVWLAQKFIVLPMTVKGVQIFSQVINQEIATYAVSEEAQPPLPEVLSVRPKRWLDRNQPDPEAIRSMIAQLQSYLGDDGFYWLAACAVFPELHWNITVYLGRFLKTKKEESLLEVLID